MAVESHDKKLDDLLKMVEEGKAQLPDFQRSWVWDDTKICKLIESITNRLPTKKKKQKKQKKTKTKKKKNKKTKKKK